MAGARACCSPGVPIDFAQDVARPAFVPQNGPVRIRVLGMVTAAVAATLLLPGVSGPEAAQAAGSVSTTVVRGTAFPDPLTAQLSFVGCSSLSGVTPESPQPSIGTGPATPPAGTRSLGFDLTGGNAVGALFMRASMADTATADVQAYAAAGTTGVAYAGYQEPADAGTGLVWVGRAEVTVGAGAWQQVSAIGRTFTWTKRDLQTGVEVLPAAGVQDLTSFMAAHGGDGAGFYTVGLGCDGNPFSLDDLRVGTAGSARAFDLEGLATTTTIGGTDSVVAGDAARLTGAVRDQAGAPIAGATLLLEQRSAAGGAWSTVYRDDAGTAPVVVDAAAGDPVVEVTPERTTSYRWRFVDRPLAEGSASAPFVVTVTPVLTARATPGRVVTGTLTPAVPGTTVSLWRNGRAGTVALARDTVDADGRYAIPVPAEAGGELVVRYAGTAQLQAATSDPVRVEALVEPSSPAAEPTQAPAGQQSAPSTAGQPEKQEPANQEPAKQEPAEPESEPTEQPSAPASTPANTPASTPAQPEQQPEQPPAATTETTGS